MLWSCPNRGKVILRYLHESILILRIVMILCTILIVIFYLQATHKQNQIISLVNSPSFLSMPKVQFIQEDQNNVIVNSKKKNNDKFPTTKRISRKNNNVSPDTCKKQQIAMRSNKSKISQSPLQKQKNKLHPTTLQQHSVTGNSFIDQRNTSSIKQYHQMFNQNQILARKVKQLDKSLQSQILNSQNLRTKNQILKYHLQQKLSQAGLGYFLRLKNSSNLSNIDIFIQFRKFHQQYQRLLKQQSKHNLLKQSLQQKLHLYQKQNRQLNDKYSQLNEVVKRHAFLLEQYHQKESIYKRKQIETQKDYIQLKKQKKNIENALLETQQQRKTLILYIENNEKNQEGNDKMIKRLQQDKSSLYDQNIVLKKLNSQVQQQILKLRQQFQFMSRRQNLLNEQKHKMQLQFNEQKRLHQQQIDLMTLKVLRRQKQVLDCKDYYSSHREVKKENGSQRSTPFKEKEIYTYREMSSAKLGRNQGDSYQKNLHQLQAQIKSKDAWIKIKENQLKEKQNQIQAYIRKFQDQKSTKLNEIRKRQAQLQIREKYKQHQNVNLPQKLSQLSRYERQAQYFEGEFKKQLKFIVDLRGDNLQLQTDLQYYRQKIRSMMHLRPNQLLSQLRILQLH